MAAEYLKYLEEKIQKLGEEALSNQDEMTIMRIAQLALEDPGMEKTISSELFDVERSDLERIKYWINKIL